MKLRSGDVISFHRGGNVYTGMVLTLDPLLKGCTVQVGKAVGRRPATPWHVKVANVVRIEEPLLTDKEVIALRMLDRHARPRSIPMRAMREKGYKVASRTLAGLAERGLVVPTREGVTARGPSLWGLTLDGERAARRLR